MIGSRAGAVWSGRRWSRRAVFVCAAALSLGYSLVVLAQPSTAEGAASDRAAGGRLAGGVPGGVWGTAIAVSGFNAVNSVSCSLPGDCAAVGGPALPGESPEFVIDEVNGAWDTAHSVPGLDSLNVGNWAVFNAVSCSAPGNCAAGGYYTGAGPHYYAHAFVVDEVDGTWGTAQEVPGSLPATSEQATVTTMSCTGPGDCSAGGYYDFQTFVADEVHGVWGSAEQVPGTEPGDYGTAVKSVSCVAPGDCAAGGFDLDGPFVADEVAGIWGSAQSIPGLAALNTGRFAEVTSVSCTKYGDCTAGGYYDSGNSEQTVYQPFVADEVNGVWGSVHKIAGAGKYGGQVLSVSCAAPGDCAVGGWYSGSAVAFVADEVNGVWSAAKGVPGVAALDVGGEARVNAVSCAAPGDCSAGGWYLYAVGNPGENYPGPSAAFVVTEVKGVWGTAQAVKGGAVGDDGISSVSCAGPGDCAAGAGEGLGCEECSAPSAFLVDETPSSLVLSVAPSEVVFGKEQAARISVTVTPSADHKVIVTAHRVAGGPSVRICSVTLVAGGGSCGLAAKKLSAGKYDVVASDSISGAVDSGTLTVARATSATRLALSAESVSQADQADERFRVVVRAQLSGPPAGRVTITASSSGHGSVRVCQIRLRTGRGSCKLASGKLAAGSYQITAVYLGNADFRPSTSARRTLKITL